ncbi:MAG: hypothetical protein ACK40G_15285 [Cytophagaceae bacterium]
MNQRKLIHYFSHFLEGVIEELKLNGNDMNIKLECKYLAESITPGYEYFYCVLKKCSDLYFQFWDDEEVKITELREIAFLKPEILNVEKDGDYIKLFVNCVNGHTGGNLYFKAKDIKVYDEDFSQISEEDMLEINDKYWQLHNKAEG